MIVKFVDTMRNSEEDYTFVLNIDVSNTSIGRSFCEDMLSPEKWRDETDCDYSYQQWVEEVLRKGNVVYHEVECDVVIEW